MKNAPAKLRRLVVATLLMLGCYLLVTHLWLFIDEVFYPFGHARIIESRGKVSLAEARRQIDIGYPDSAHDIQFASFSHWIAIEQFVRFEAPVNDCVSFVNDEIVRHNAAHPDRLVPGLNPMMGSVHPWSSSNLSTEWFDLHAIKNGLSAGSEGSHTPQFWVDTDRGVVYYKYTD